MRNPGLHWTSFALLVAGSLLSPAMLRAQEMDLPWSELGAALVDRMHLQPAETVLLVGRAGPFDPLIPELQSRIEAAGAHALGAVDVGGTGFTGISPTAFVAQLQGLESDALVRALLPVHLGVMLPGATPTDPVYAALQDVLRQGIGRTIHFHWAGAYGFDGTLLDLDDRINRTYVEVLTRTDYDALAEAQASFEASARAGEVHVTTPAGTDLRFRIGERPVTRQDGDATLARTLHARNLIDREVELPAGAIRVAPVEGSVNGTIAFPPTVWGGTTVEGLVLTIDRGRVVDVAADTGVDAVLAEMDQAGPAGRAFREFALGMNPLLAIPDDEPAWIPYYGYGAGVVRLSLGDNSELGGAVTGGYVRWNFFTDATVTVGGDVWVEGGRLVR
jgi:hypothetical protein